MYSNYTAALSCFSLSLSACCDFAVAGCQHSNSHCFGMHHYAIHGCARPIEPTANSAQFNDATLQI
jgi:hypothetical protein